MNEESTIDLTVSLTNIASDLRALSNAGIHYTEDPYQIERYHRIIELSAALTSLANGHSAAELRQLFFADLHYKTPYAVVDTALFNDADRLLLIRRADNGLWALPGGACDVGEPPVVGAAREVWEETGYVAQVSDFIGIFDNRFNGGKAFHHLYCLLFAGRAVGGDRLITRETLDCAWFAEDEIPWAAVTPSHLTRIRHAFAWHKEPTTPVFFDRVTWQPEATNQHAGATRPE
ncbi:MAG: NUDIX hydrolase N-terminal domain-containing protein [Caldilineaceae bacterium]|nr:NUDIX hydrolase N-terminal domain-containing protein [Caldilineaceae bacterium]